MRDVKTTLAAELRSIFTGQRMLKDFRIVGNVAYGVLNESTNAKIEFITRGYADHYNALRITILKKTEGVVDSCVIGFETVWGLKELACNVQAPYIWRNSSNDISWYIWQPSAADKQKLYNTIKSYLELWK